MSKKYKIGQVLYIISPKTQAVIPVQIQEINQRTTIEGEETIYMIMDPDGRGPFNLGEVKGEIYTNPSDVGVFLKENASKAIDAMVHQARDIAESKFGATESEDEVFPQMSTPKEKPLPKTKRRKVQPQVIEVKEKSSSEEELVSVIGKDGKSHMQKTKIRVKGLDGEVLSA